MPGKACRTGCRYWSIFCQFSVLTSFSLFSGKALPTRVPNWECGINKKCREFNRTGWPRAVARPRFPQTRTCCHAPMPRVCGARRTSRPSGSWLESRATVGRKRPIVHFVRRFAAKPRVRPVLIVPADNRFPRIPESPGRCPGLGELQGLWSVKSTCQTCPGYFAETMRSLPAGLELLANGSRRSAKS
jgi:hypothetical protein